VPDISLQQGIVLAVLASGLVYFGMWLVLRQREKDLADTLASEARFRALTELSADWFWETDADHHLVWLSGGGPVAMLFGESKAYGQRLWEIPGIEVAPQALRAHRERLSRELDLFDLEISRADARGARQIHIVSGRCRRDAEGRVTGYRGVGRDVTAERRAERVLADAKERVERALHGGNLAEWHFDTQSGEVYGGDGWARFLNQERGPTMLRIEQLAERIHVDDLGPARVQFVRLLKGEREEFDAEVRISLRRTGWKWLHARGRVVERGEDGRARRVSGVVADIDESKRAQSALSEAEHRWRSLVELSPDGILVSCNRVVEYANPAAARIAGFDSPAELVGRNMSEFIAPAHKARHEERMAYMDTGPGRLDFEERVAIRRVGIEIIVETASVSFLERGRLLTQSVFRDVTENRKAREALAEREQRFRDVAEAAGEYVWETDAEGRFTFLSARVEAVVGFTPGEMLGRLTSEFLPLGEGRSVQDWFSHRQGWRKPFRDLVIRSITKSGRVIWQSVSAVPRLDAEGNWCGYRGTAADVTARRQAEDRIEYLSTRDALTGLANRALLAERTSQAIRDAARSRSRLALLCIDLERFRLVNEAFGHLSGDALLRAVAERLNNALRREDTLARLGADHFVLLWNGLRTDLEATMLAQRVLAVLGRPFTLDGRTVGAGASVGIALYPEHGRDFTELLKSADTALAHAKSAARGSHAFYDPALGAAARDRVRVENELRSALARSELVLHWHPVLKGENEVVGAEALVRWQHPERGLLMPEDFVPLAEESGLISQIGAWNLERAFSQAGAWQKTLPGSPWIAINVTARELAEGERFVRRLQAALNANGLEASRVELEVTERALLADERHVQTLRAIGALGMRISVDDFGTGYSSLAYLRRLPVQKIKLDRMFMRGLADDATDQAIVRTVTSLAHTLGVAVAAEGIESRAQLERLLELGCDHWQGHYFSEPLDAAAFERLALSSGSSSRISSGAGS
jgi:diguanylate cyclase (GGDEF)-like protein/PAS domain S-box-containing protein